MSYLPPSKDIASISATAALKESFAKKNTSREQLLTYTL